MREIKFRAWDKEEKLMLYDIQLYLEHKDKDGNEYDGYEDWKFDDFLTDSDIEVMQFTGLKDKNGKEIYEGDWVKCVNGQEGEVVWEDHDCCFNVSDYYSPSDDYPTMAFMEGQPMEVLGNIYENPDLLGS